MNHTKPEHFILNSLAIRYFHSHEATRELVEQAALKGVIFEFDLSWAHTAFHPNLKQNTPYVGHPNYFYSIESKKYPENNLSFEEIKTFFLQNPKAKVLIDIKDAVALATLEQFLIDVGSDRCVVHSFIKEWSPAPSDIEKEPHWDTESLSIVELDPLLRKYNVPLIANCRIFPCCDLSSEKHLKKVIKEAKHFSSIFALGLYYNKAPIPASSLLKKNQ
jgi:hypothetical protein